MGKILFDLEATQPSVSGRRHGGGIYGEIILKKLIEKKADLVCAYNPTRWLNPEIERLCRDNGVPLVPTGKSWQSLASEHGCDRIYFPIPGNKTLGKGDAQEISTLHGLRELETPNDPFQLRYPGMNAKRRVKYLLNKWYPKLLRKRKSAMYEGLLRGRTVVVSHHTANAVRYFFPKHTKEAIPVFYSPLIEPAAKLPADRAAEYPYFLMVSGNRWEKNVLRAVMAFERLFDGGLLEGMKVHITGLKRLEDLKYRFRHPERFVALGYVEDDELQRQYRDAYALVYPTLNEGFGYPPLEAMRYGTPVAASGVCSVPEVCGDAALYFNPMDIAEIGGRIVALTDSDTHRRLHEAALRRYAEVGARQAADLDAMARWLME